MKAEGQNYRIRTCSIVEDRGLPRDLLEEHQRRPDQERLQKAAPEQTHNTCARQLIRHFHGLPEM